MSDQSHDQPEYNVLADAVDAAETSDLIARARAFLRKAVDECPAELTPTLARAVAAVLAAHQDERCSTTRR